ncbi:MAG: RsmB/NOP family class I SAM-dependent RNA methyltransferase [Spirochaetes bacterium]|nr:RsmB/NOP family class I SAM-dependent RNA methyltransferase [Spirochaetota bacterium]
MRTASVGEMRRRLPAEFIEGLYGLFPQAVAERILKGMGERRSTTFRANTLKAGSADIIRFLHGRHIKYRRPSWYADAFVLAELDERDVGRWDFYADGRIYVQGLSSMVPALALAPKPGERVLDVAAAPGSKTTQVAALMGNRGSIVANEPNAVRAERLAYNVRLQGCSIVEVRRDWGEKLGAAMPDAFDRVLIDAPCSGEGRFTAAEPGTWRSWSRRTVTESARLQRRLLASGIRALKPGGTLVYSTCTLNDQENEAIIEGAIDGFALSVEPIPVRMPGALPGLRGIDRAVRILPDRDHEGFFVCRMRKRV